MYVEKMDRNSSLRTRLIVWCQTVEEHVYGGWGGDYANVTSHHEEKLAAGEANENFMISSQKKALKEMHSSRIKRGWARNKTTSARETQFSNS